MVRLFKSAAAQALAISVLALLIGAALLGALRLAVPYAGLLRAPVEAFLAEHLGLDVEVGGLGLRLVGWTPRLSLTDARLVDPETGRTQLSLKELYLDLDAAASLRARTPKVAGLTLVGAHLVVRRGADGRLSVAGLEGLTGGNPEAITFFLGNGRFLLTESDLYLTDGDAQTPVLHLTDVTSRLDNQGLSHRLGLRGRPLGEPRAEVRLAADLEGPPGVLADWGGSIYLRWQGNDLGPLLEARLPAELHLGTSTAEIEAWGELQGGTLVNGLIRLDLRGLSGWREAPDGSAASVHLAQLAGRVRWEELQAGGWQIAVSGLRLARRSASPPEMAVDLRVAPLPTGGWAASGAVDQLDLGLGRELLRLLPEPPGIAAAEAAQVDGVVEDLRWSYQGGAPPQWSVTGRLADLALLPAGKVPGMSGLSGWFSATPRGGTFALEAEDLRIALPDVLRGPIRLAHASGEVHWAAQADGGLRVWTDRLAAANADVSTESRLALHIPGESGNAPFLDLQTDFAEVPAEALSKYIPSGLLKPSLVGWLDRAFVGGRVPAGTLIFRGAPADFPFVHAEGRFLVDLSVVDGVLDYRPGWPRIEAIAAEVRFDGPSLNVLASSGRLLQSELREVSAEIPDLHDAHTRVLRVHGRAEGPFADALRILRETPLAGRFGALAAQFEASGGSRLVLGLDIPLRRPGEQAHLALEGTLSWSEDAALTLPAWGIDLGALAGELRFTEAGLSAEKITARLWDAPVELRITTGEGVNGGGRRTRVEAEGRQTSASLAEHFPSPLWGLLRGASDFRLDVEARAADLDGGRLPLEVALRSDLRGLAVDLPAPLGKTAAARRPLTLQARLAAGQPPAVSGSYGDLGFVLGLALPPEGGLRLTGASLQLDGSPRAERPPEGLRISGSLASLDLTAWLNWLDRLPSGENPTLGLRSAEIRLGRLLASDLELHDLSLRLERDLRGWRGGLEARELAGTAVVPSRPREAPIEVRLARLDLAGLLRESGGAGARRERGGSPLSPRTAPALDLRIERLLWDEDLIGAVAMTAEARPDGLALTGLSLDGPLLTVRGRGSWTGQGELQGTELKLTTETKDLGALLRQLEFKSQLADAPASGTLELRWPGGPGDLSLATIHGEAKAEIGAGSLLEVEPGVGRMLGILNLGALQRRLSLDFRDLFNRGYAFEEIGGVLAIGGGKARIERLDIEGPSASISVEGETDLVAQRFDQVVTVTPRLGSSLAVASAVAAGPLVGAAVYLADRVSGGVVDRIGRYQYQVTGPWEDPDIQRRGVPAEPEASLPPDPTPASPPGEGRVAPSDLGPFLDGR